MAQGARQSSLFAAEDFSVVYESFAQANFQAYDFDTIKNAMVEYIDTNYPENFNDWISSSEFTSLLELMAFLGHNLAFRNDLNSRENYLSTAERRDSALRIAEFLGYNPTRNVVASGYLKIDSIKTTETVYDVDGNSLANVDLQFEDVTDPTAYQNFITVMNSTFNSSNQFGTPFSRGVRDGITNEIYRTTSIGAEPSSEFNANVSGSRAVFGAHSVYLNSSLNRIQEKTPDPFGALDIIYRNDNGGFSSPDTGFFFGFKQGTLQFKDFGIADGLPNLVLDIDDINVANGNIWVQTVDEVGQVLTDWMSVDRIFGLNAIYNNLDNNFRNIYTVSSREDDKISIVFGDGDFGNIPRGIIRVWYRTGLNLSYTLNPESFGTTSYSFNYLGSDGNTYRATFTASLKSRVSNASQRESLQSIKDNAGRFHSTQDRLVTAEDYSIFPLTVSENIRKIKSINRVHSGHSRFRDFNDPTGSYSDAIQFLDDGYLYREDVAARSVVSLPTNLNSEQTYSRFIKPLLDNPEVKNFFYDRQYYGPDGSYTPASQYTNTTANIVYHNADGTPANTFRWNQVTKGGNTSTGYLTNDASIIQRVKANGIAPMNKIDINSIIEFVTPPYKIGYISSIKITSAGSGYTSDPTVSITGAGTGATGTANIDGSGALVSITITDSGLSYDSATSVTITGGGGSGATATAVVSSADTKWVRVTGIYNDGLGIDNSVGTPTGIDQIGRGSVTLSEVIPSGARIKRIIPSWANDLTSTVKTDVLNLITNNNSFGLRYDATTQAWVVVTGSNLVTSSLTNNNPSSWNRTYEGDTNGTGLDNSWIIRLNYTSSQWEIVTRKTRYIFGSDEQIKFANLNFAETFSSETLKPSMDNIKVLGINSKSKSNSLPIGSDYTMNASGYFTYPDGYTDPNKIRLTLSSPTNDGFPVNPSAFHDIVGDETITLNTKVIDGFTYTVHDASSGTSVTGRSGLASKYTRIADVNQVIDPATTNIIDTYVLLSTYENSFRTWARYDGRGYTKPNPPTISSLNDLFKSLDNKKSISDQVIYRPVKYKILFGDLASSELQAKFNVTKTANCTLSDTEIKQEVIRLVNAYFGIDNWDFGETFYFTELAAFIHNNTVGQVAQINIESVDNQAKPNALFEIISDSDELFLPVITTSNITVSKSTVYNPTSIAANSGVNIK
jgi:hypothetical protein